VCDGIVRGKVTTILLCEPAQYPPGVLTGGGERSTLGLRSQARGQAGTLERRACAATVVLTIRTGARPTSGRSELSWVDRSCANPHAWNRTQRGKRLGMMGDDPRECESLSAITRMPCSRTPADPLAIMLDPETDGPLLAYMCEEHLAQAIYRRLEAAAGTAGRGAPRR
jgi:hypothetical protein